MGEGKELMNHPLFLRGYARQSEKHGNTELASLCQVAADEIDRLRAENERLEKVRIFLLMHLNDICAAHISEDEDGMIESIELAQKAITKSILGGADDDH